MRGRCNVLRQSPEGRRAWDAFVLPSEQGAETPEGMIRVEGGLATSCVSCCSCAVKAARVVLMLFLETFCLSVSS